MNPEHALERLVVHTAMEDGTVALECEAVLKPALAKLSEVMEENARLSRRVKEAQVQLNNAEATMDSNGWWRNPAGYVTDAALWIEQAQKALSREG